MRKGCSVVKVYWIKSERRVLLAEKVGSERRVL